MGFQIGLKLKENQTIWRITHFTDVVKEILVDNGLVFNQFLDGIELVMHIGV
ncbi:hypothetical protein P872_15645 [Rhodonellum psychrophilum GCM71 = DSM 17998]|uniref:Uncharacterized protein n=1 Tax=Rhodonellum psychrophilum GCM71 = DSM 17998 TaxID=1123057 RepID=U5BUA6_9BACT|nr:hypothetical protein P872_15645 [Rhodonellum psychrophilum GCM71 = DSM 17998]